MKLLLDEHVSPRIAIGLRKQNPDAAVEEMVEWRCGNFLGQTDDVLLDEASAEGLTLVTYD